MRICLFCKKTTGIHLKEHRLSVCKECYPGWLEKQIALTISKFKMLKPEDKILLAVSGGKDSLALWQILTRLGAYADGLYVSLGIASDEYSDISRQKCLQMAEKLGRKLIVVDLKKEIGYTIDDIYGIDRKVCSACGTVKRYYMNKLTRDLGYSVIATGHNLDDEVTTLFGNLMRWDEGHLDRQFPIIPQTEYLAKKIKPLAKTYEKQMALYAITSQIDYIRNECPYSRTATSIEYKENLCRLEINHPGLMKFFFTNFINAKRRKIKEGVELEREKPQIIPCGTCGQPTVTQTCRFCKLQIRLQQKDEKKKQRQNLSS